jgi:hypothetical protein
MATIPTLRDGAPSARHVPEKCPVCQHTPSPLTEEALRAHLETHRPQAPCRHPHPPVQPHKMWLLDWDLVAYPRSDLSPWYCFPCGHYAPQA